MGEKLKTSIAILKEIKKPLKILKLEVPDPKKNQIVIKINFTYICGSQMNEIYGNRGKDKYLPHSLGHEASGTIFKIGKNVKKFKIGQKVVLSWIKKKESASILPYYLTKNNKKISSGMVSTFSEFVIVSKDRVYSIPQNLPMDIAALLGCALPTGFGIVHKFARDIDKGKFVSIYGIGGVGLMVLIALKQLGFKKIITIDKNQKNLKIAKKIGVMYACSLNYFNKKIVDQKIKKSNIALNIEISGNEKMTQSAINNLDAKGKVIIAGNIKKGNFIKLNPYDLIFGKNLLGFSGNDVSLEKNLKKYIAILKKFGLNKVRKFYKSYQFKHINKAIADFKSGKVLRPLIKIN